MPTVDPQAAMTRCCADDRLHVGATGAAAHPGLALDGLSEIQQLACGFLRTHELARGGTSIRAGDLGATGDAQASLLRRHDVAPLRVERGHFQYVAADVVTVVAALGEQRPAVPHPSREFLCGRADRHHCQVCFNKAVGSLPLPRHAAAAQAVRIALDEATAAPLEQLRVALHERTWVRDAPRAE